MTVMVAVKTGAAALLAADSKLSTQVFTGKNSDGSPNYIPQTYDHAIKIAEDASGTAIGGFAGSGLIGEQNAVDYFARLRANLHELPADQDKRVQAIADEMVAARESAKTKFKLPTLSPTVVLLIAAPLNEVAPRVWKIQLDGDKASPLEILKNPGVWIEGSAEMPLTLLYGMDNVRSEALRDKLEIDAKAFADAVGETVSSSVVNRINFWAMPTQDAMDFAVFCAEVQVQMDRFLPGLGTCGGPIDLMTLEMAPVPKINAFPGKSLHHPARSS